MSYLVLILELLVELVLLQMMMFLWCLRWIYGTPVFWEVMVFLALVHCKYGLSKHFNFLYTMKETVEGDETELYSPNQPEMYKSAIN